MQKKIKFLLLLMCFSFSFSAFAEPIESAIYKGKLGTHDILLYVGKGEGCGGNDFYYSAIYSYDNGKHWLLLDVTHNKNGFYCMVEHGFTGVLMLSETANSLNGTWSSPDRKKTLDVQLTKEKSSAKKLKEAFDAWDKLNYEKNDC